ncbi:MAG: phosphoribosylformylglycinamidine synthase I [Planctomycetia bacterium]
MTRSRDPRVLVVRAPGTNCEQETAFAFEAAGAAAVHAHLNALLARPRLLDEVQGLVLPGGFSFGDDLGAGTVYGALVRNRLLPRVRRLVDRGGIVLGICNGFQVLVKTGLLPALDGSEEQAVALAANVSNRYEDRWVTLEATADNAFFARGDRIACPVAHGEGRFLARDAATLDLLDAAGQLALRYVDPTGAVPARYPWNPNGAARDVAGITDPTGRVLGLMPHPERNQFPWQDPRFHAGTAPRVPEGLLPFRNAVRHLRRAFDLPSGATRPRAARAGSRRG